jgi:lipopolysaccharide export system permease protein
LPAGTHEREVVVFWSILHRMILWELAKVFVMSLIGITGILLMAGIIAEASQQGLGPTQIIAIIPFLIPSTLPYTIPATTLFATCVVYGRLAADNEILAVRAAGINLIHVVWPAVFLGLIMSAVTMGLYYRIIPYTHHLMRSMFLKDVEESLYTMLKKDRGQLYHPKLVYAMFVRQVDGRKLRDAIFKKKGADGNFDLVLWAREAELRVDVPRKQVLVHMQWGEGCGGANRGLFESQTIPVPLPEGLLDTGPTRPRDMTWQEILQRRRDIEKEIEAVGVEIAQNASSTLISQPPRQFTKHSEDLRGLIKMKEQETRALDAELQMRPALAFGCLFFVLVGCPVGIWFSKSDYLSAFITCFLPIVFLYYPLLLCGTNFAREGKFVASLDAWIANLAMGAIAVWLYYKLLKN